MPPRPPSKSKTPSEPKPAKQPNEVSTPHHPQRLQKLLASAGYGSRRQCEELIELGRVEVDGVIVTKLGSTVDPQVSKVRVDGSPLKVRRLTYYAVNKPVGIVTTNRDPHGRPRVIDLVPPSERVFPVGRLDRNSEGLILLTNDGDLAQQLTHPKFGVRKIYRVTVAGHVDNETMEKMRKGIYIAEGLVRVDGAKIIKAGTRATDLEIVLREGKNREIRRILARFGHKVQQLRRIAVGTLRLGDTPPGSYRILTREEVQKLRREVAHPVAESEFETESPRSSIKRPRKSFDKNKSKSGPPNKRPAVKPTGSRRPLPRDRAAAKAFDFGESQTVGFVIGEEGDVVETRTNRGGKKRSSVERTGSHRVAGKPSGTKSGVKRGGAKKRPVKKGAKRTASANPVESSSSRRGVARVTKKIVRPVAKKRAVKRNTVKKRPAK